MRHSSREEGMIERLLRATRTIAVVGASPRPARHSSVTVSYLHQAGYDVIPVRLDRVPVAGLPSFASLEDFGGAVDMVVIFRRPEAVVTHIHQAIAKRIEAVWLQPGVWSREAEEAARSHDLTLIKDRCIVEEHRHLITATGEPSAGHPRKQGTHARRRPRHLPVDDSTPPDPGYVEGGGGGQKAGGGKRSVRDERKMTNRAGRDD
jgi:predicted CoA-binding protein